MVIFSLGLMNWFELVPSLTVSSQVGNDAEQTFRDHALRSMVHLMFFGSNYQLKAAHGLGV
jgi:hypothetical protein